MVAVNSDNLCWRFYKSGVLRSRHGCHYNGIDHVVVIVGLEEGPPIPTAMSMFGWLFECEYSPWNYCAEPYFERIGGCGEAKAFEGEGTPCCCRLSKDREPDNDVWVM